MQSTSSWRRVLRVGSRASKTLCSTTSTPSRPSQAPCARCKASSYETPTHCTSNTRPKTWYQKSRPSILFQQGDIPHRMTNKRASEKRPPTSKRDGIKGIDALEDAIASKWSWPWLKESPSDHSGKQCSCLPQLEHDNSVINAQTKDIALYFSPAAVSPWSNLTFWNMGNISSLYFPVWGSTAWYLSLIMFDRTLEQGQRF